METTIMGHIRVKIWLDRDNGKEHGNYYLGCRVRGLAFRDPLYFLDCFVTLPRPATPVQFLEDFPPDLHRIR